MSKKKITTLFCDIGGVILTNGWGRESRAKAAEKFGFDLKETETRHQLMFGDYETGRISLEDYLKHAYFFVPRSFTMEAFKNFMFDQSQLLPDMYQYLMQLKEKWGLKVVLLSNEGREITRHRIDTFNLKKLGDFFVVSCYVGFRKPDRRMYTLSIDLVDEKPENILYLDDRDLFIQIAKEEGIEAVLHKDFASTKSILQPILPL